MLAPNASNKAAAGNGMASIFGRRPSIRRRSSVAPQVPVVKETPQDKDRFKFKYIRLQSQNLNKTLDFYQALGMTVVWEMDLDECTRAAYLRFETTEPEFNERSVGLFFEHQFAEKKKTEDQEQKEKEANQVQKPPKLKAKVPTQQSRDAMVIYVRFLSRLYKRLQAKNFEIKIPLETYYDIQYTILMDPNGLEVRLVECTEQQLIDSDLRTSDEERNQWFARFGYFSTEMKAGDQVAAFYEQYLALSADDRVNSNGPRVDVSSLLARGNKKMTTNVASKTGFRIVDCEDIVNGLSHDYFWWLGNDIRERFGTVNFVERAASTEELIKKKATEEQIAPGPQFISFGFELNPNLRIEHLRKMMKSAVFSLWLKPLGEIGYMSRIKDPTGRTIEIFAAGNKNESIATKRVRVERRTNKDTQHSKTHAGLKHDRHRSKSFGQLLQQLSVVSLRSEFKTHLESTRRRTKSLSNLDKDADVPDFKKEVNTNAKK